MSFAVSLVDAAVRAAVAAHAPRRTVAATAAAVASVVMAARASGDSVPGLAVPGGDPGVEAAQRRKAEKHHDFDMLFRVLLTLDVPAGYQRPAHGGNHELAPGPARLERDGDPLLRKYSHSNGGSMQNDQA